MIDAYEDGFLDRAEFEPRIRAAKERLTHLQAEANVQAVRETREEEVRHLVGRLQAFTDQVKAGLENADWNTRREIIRALVKRIEVEKEQVRVVYRIDAVCQRITEDSAPLQDHGSLQ